MPATPPASWPCSGPDRRVIAFCVEVPPCRRFVAAIARARKSPGPRARCPTAPASTSWSARAAAPRWPRRRSNALQVELRRLDQLAHAVQEAVAGHAVDHAVIVRERQVHHGADDDGVLALELAHHGAL